MKWPFVARSRYQELLDAYKDVVQSLERLDPKRRKARLISLKVAYARNKTRAHMKPTGLAGLYASANSLDRSNAIQTAALLRAEIDQLEALEKPSPKPPTAPAGKRKASK
jgi:hypothetical protein